MVKMKISRSVVLAASLAGLAVIWMMTGLLGTEPEPGAGSQAQSAPASGSLIQVSVRQSSAEPVTRDVSISARTEPNRSVQVAAETDGRIVSITAERGARIHAGQVIARIDMRDRNIQATEAEALVKQREVEYQAAQRLRDREFISESQIAQANAALESARAALERIRLDIARTEITAPFDGIMEEREVELGDFVRIGDPIASLVDLDPLVVVGDVSEREIQELNIGSTGEATLLSGEVIKGNVRYVSPVASSTTRTFRVELSIPNPDGLWRAGVSADIHMPAGDIMAHHMTPALLTLDAEGNIGVKTVDENNRVRFYPVEIVESNNAGVWVTGLPDHARVITIGQGFVTPGDTVQPVSAGLSLPDNETSSAP